MSCCLGVIFLSVCPWSGRSCDLAFRILVCLFLLVYSQCNACTFTNSDVAVLGIHAASLLSIIPSLNACCGHLMSGVCNVMSYVKSWLTVCHLCCLFFCTPLQFQAEQSSLCTGHCCGRFQHVGPVFTEFCSVYDVIYLNLGLHNYMSVCSSKSNFSQRLSSN